MKQAVIPIRNNGVAITLWAGVLTCLIGCPMPVNTPAPPTGEAVSFSGAIQPIFNSRCVSCHQTGGIADLVGIGPLLVDGESYDNLVNQPSEQRPELTLVIPGDSASSLVFQKVSQNSPPVGSRMPSLGDPLTAGELALLRDWIDQGALDN